MDEMFAIAGFGRCKRGQQLRVWLIIAAVAFAVISLPASSVIAGDSDDSLPPGIGSLNDYMHEGEPPGQVYNPHQQNAAPEAPGYYNHPGYYPPPGNYGPPPSYGSPSGSQMAVGAAVVGALIVAALAYQQYQARQQERRAMRRYRRYQRHRPLPPPPPPGYGF
jgi:hypothetical protein